MLRARAIRTLSTDSKRLTGRSFVLLAGRSQQQRGGSGWGVRGGKTDKSFGSTRDRKGWYQVAPAKAGRGWALKIRVIKSYPCQTSEMHFAKITNLRVSGVREKRRQAIFRVKTANGRRRADGPVRSKEKTFRFCWETRGGSM